MSILPIENLSYTYPGGQKSVLREVSAGFEAGKMANNGKEYEDEKRKSQNYVRCDRPVPCAPPACGMREAR